MTGERPQIFPDGELPDDDVACEGMSGADGEISPQDVVDGVVRFKKEVRDLHARNLATMDDWEKRNEEAKASMIFTVGGARFRKKEDRFLVFREIVPWTDERHGVLILSREGPAFLLIEGGNENKRVKAGKKVIELLEEGRNVDIEHEALDYYGNTALRIVMRTENGRCELGYKHQDYSSFKPVVIGCLLLLNEEGVNLYFMKHGEMIREMSTIVKGAGLAANKVREHLPEAPKREPKKKKRG